MLRLNNRFLFVLPFLCLFFPAGAQRLAIDNYSINNGIPQSQIIDLYQDHSGVMWVGTSGGGICKYDGIRFIDITTRDGLKNNRVYSIYEDANNDIWVGTLKGLNKISNNKVTSFNDTTVDKKIVYGITQRANGEFWFATSKGIAIYDKGEFRPFQYNDSLAGVHVLDVEEDYFGNIWIATLGKGVFCFKAGRLLHFSKSNGLLDDKVNDIMINNGKVWIGTPIGITIYDPLKSALGSRAFRYALNEGNPKGIQSMCKNTKGDVWIGTTQGAYKFSSKGDTTRITINEGLPSNRVTTIMEDREGNMWCGTYGGGVCKYKGDMFKAFTDKEGLCSNTVMSIYKDSHGNFWFGTWGGGVCTMDYNEWKRSRKIVMKNITVEDGLRHRSIWSVAEDKNGHMWFGSISAGCFVWDGKSMKLYNMENKKLGGNKISGLMRDNDGNVWISHENGVDIYDGEAFSSLDQVQGFSPKPVTAMCQDLENNVWLASQSSILKYDGSIVTEYTPAQTITRIKTLAEDKYGNIWLSIDGGICVFDGKNFKTLDEKDGLSSSTAYYALPDDRGNLWIGTNRGVDKFNLYLYQKSGETQIKHYGSDEGFIGIECNQNSFYKDNDGLLWFGTVEGVTIYNPEADKYNAIEPRTTINQLRLFYENYDFAEFSDTVLNSLPVNLKLPYDKNYLTFDFTGVCHTLPQKVRYQFMMEGFDKKWSGEVNVTSATYSNLPPGKYTFLLRACNNDGVWNRTPAEFSFEIIPPFWQTTWFYVLCALAGIAAIFTITLVRERNFRLAKKILETKVEFRTKELREEQEKLQKAYVQIDDKNKDIMDSIHYAKRIQESILPPDDEIRKLFPDSFVFFKPKDIVSGDFYWVEKWGHQTVIAAVDCTGHGVPGAFMSIVGSNILTEAVNVFGLTKPSLILNELSRQLSRALHHKTAETYLKDGMDLAVCMFDKDNSRLEFAGAFNPLWHFRDGKFKEVKADRFSIGAAIDSVANNFTNHQLDLKKGDTIYIFSDGYADQFGGPAGKKFKHKQMQRMLATLQHLSMEEQGKIIERTIEEWRGNNEQIDDMLVMGIRV